MTDIKLLEYAAKAAGITYHSYINDPIMGTGINIGEVDVPLWNPLMDDGDAFRLAVKLEMFLDLTIAMQDGADVQASIDEHHFDVECNGDPYVATRRAIVLAAAEIGKAMP